MCAHRKYAKIFRNIKKALYKSIEEQRNEQAKLTYAKVNITFHHYLENSIIIQSTHTTFIGKWSQLMPMSSVHQQM